MLAAFQLEQDLKSLAVGAVSTKAALVGAFEVPLDRGRAQIQLLKRPLFLVAAHIVADGPERIRQEHEDDEARDRSRQGRSDRPQP